jgi:preprotein translocase subunit YajC
VNEGAGVSGLLFPILLIALFWFLAIRPARRRQAAQRAVVQALTTGSQVVTTSGLHGTIVGLDDATVRLEVAPGVIVTWARPAILEVRHQPDQL